MALWEQGGGIDFQKRKNAGDSDGAHAQRSTAKGVLTCSIATILHAKHSESENCFLYKHLKFNTVLIMGLIRETNQEVNGSLATYNIDDHSGASIEIKWWHDDSGERLKALTYVKVVGQVKVFSGKTHVVAHHFTKMQSLNELMAHAIECIHTSMAIRKHNELNGTTNPIPGHQAAVSNGFSLIQTAVLNYLRTATTSTGFSVANICKQVKQFSEDQVKQAVEFLSDEGHIYSTTDDEHFRAASNN